MALLGMSEYSPPAGMKNFKGLIEPTIRTLTYRDKQNNHFGLDRHFKMINLQS